MSVEVELKSKIFKLLREDEMFRYAVAGLIGLEEILRRLEKHDERFISIEEEIRKLRENMNKGLKRYDEELAGLREDMNRGFQLMDRRLRYLEAFTERVSLIL